LIESEKLYRLIVENVTDIIWIVDMEMKFTYFSPSVTQVRGYSVEEAMAQSVEESMTPASFESAMKMIAEELELHNKRERDPARSRKMEAELTCKDGSTVWTEIESNFIYNSEGQPIGILGITRNITERKKSEKERKHAEGEVRKSETLLKATLESTVDGILVVDEKGRVIKTNKQFAKMWRIPDDLLKLQDNEKLLNYVLDQLVEPTAFLSRVQELYKTSKHDFDTIVFKDGRIFERYSRPLIRADEIAGRVWSFRDVTERKRSKEALREAYNIINRSPAVVFLWKNAEEWPVEFASNNVKELFGYTVDEFSSGKVSYAETVHPDDLERVAEKVSTFSKEKERKEIYHEPYRIITKNGEVKWLDDSTYIRRDENGNITHYEGIVIDITDRMRIEEDKKKLETQLQQSQKMESIGTLAGGIAHEFNNIRNHSANF